ncbi:fimbrial protein [Proteus myxofaciens]|uniref:PapA family adhesin n=1 Tax=Proteus myxofaciens ATCC 19692 TaxID=1354337 RepID=A0A198GMI4_9GAMM|nr:fimbrial protein [Proteus myxofaciens]OAT38677.1 PapA family adhesin [Proteus myxofaciens ATCC 19692]
MKLTQLAVASVFAASILPLSAMADNTGTINFVGSVVNTPCNIQQSSLKQTVDFGQLSRNALESGQIAEADFDITFTGCNFADFSETEDEEGNVTKNPVKSMDIVFTGQNYSTDRTLLLTSANNTNNLGIAIDGFEFGKAENVLPNGDLGTEVTLNFKALAKAIDQSKSVAEGQFSAISNFRITYQ